MSKEGAGRKKGGDYLFSPGATRPGADSLFIIGRKGEFNNAYAEHIGARVYRIEFKEGGRVIVDGEEVPPAEVETGRAINIWNYRQGDED